MCLARSLDLTHSWCLGIDLVHEGDALVEAPIAGDYGWGPAVPEVELDDGVPAHGEWEYLLLGR